MSLTSKIIAAVYGKSIASSVTEYAHVRRTERAKRAAIDAKLAADLAALDVAEKRMIERIDAGEYDRSLNYLFTDLEFETIKAHYE